MTDQMLLSCRNLHDLIQSHHVWTDQVKSLIRRKPALRLAVPDLNSLSAEDLRAFAIRQAKLRWGMLDGDVEFARGGLIQPADISYAPHLLSLQWLLPGSNHMFVHSGRRLLLYQIRFSDDQPTLSLLSIRELDMEIDGTPHRIFLLYTVSPHPVYVRVAQSGER